VINKQNPRFKQRQG
ncbi:MAG: 50S ribosomal protein L36, partial [Flavobacterium sp.]|nr:50S ribosomal protein L36 [Flavobacterium sp.]